MSEPNHSHAVTVDEMYGEWPIDAPTVHDILDRTRSPRNADLLFEIMKRLGVGADTTVLDIGARDARHSIELAERFGCRVIAVDPVEANITDARNAVEKAHLSDLIEIHRAGIEAIPIADDEVNAVWARDMINHIADLHGALNELARVARPSSPVLIYQTFAGPLLEPLEANRIYGDLAIVPQRMSVPEFEADVIASGFTIEEVDVVSSEWREHWEEDGSHRTARQLLHAARLLRAADDMRAELGEIPYRVELSNALWGVYQMIGKLEPRAYVLRTPRVR